MAPSGLLVQELDGDGVGRPAALQRSRVHRRRRRRPCRRGRARTLRRPDRRPGGGDGVAGTARRRAGNHHRHRRALRAHRARCPGADHAPRRPPPLPRRARPRSQSAPRPGRSRGGDAGVRRHGASVELAATTASSRRCAPSPVSGPRSPSPSATPASRSSARPSSSATGGRRCAGCHRPPERGVQDLGGRRRVRSRVDGRQHPPVDPRVRRGLRRAAVHARVELARRRPVRRLRPTDRRLPRGGDALTPAERADLFHGTAVHVYRLAAVG